ncbi:MAG TPA: MBL fold metallo-hydrolase [Bryobacteraceae bacterium]|nr:MBL fold metallo-hydrolase [Bryobacteraceae bacterium]
MADRALRVAENVEGSFFVDSSCIDCDTCRQLAPATFRDAGDYSCVHTQPRNPGEERAALRALIACPTGSIGTADKSRMSEALNDFPLELAPGVFYSGFNSRKSFGGNSYFVEHPDGNWLIDSPRFVEHLVRRFEQRGGIRYIFLTHRDDVADADKWAERFGATRFIHRLELASQPDAECVLEGRDPIALAPEFLAIPTPGHTRGHCVLLYRNEFLFSGDHLWWSRVRKRLTASRDVCWYSWKEQVESVARLEKCSFTWVLPGHGERANFSYDEMRRQMTQLIRAVA